MIGRLAMARLGQGYEFDGLALPIATWRTLMSTSGIEIGLRAVVLPTECKERSARSPRTHSQAQ